MQEQIRSKLAPGTRVKVTQQIAMRDRAWTSEVRGTVVRYDQRPTGSWFAHSKSDKLWLDRLVLRKADGEVTTLNLDDYTRIDIEGPPAAAAVPAPEGAVEAAEPAPE